MIVVAQFAKHQTMVEKIKALDCPTCLGTGIENTLHRGSVLCYRCHGTKKIGYYKTKEIENDKTTR